MKEYQKGLMTAFARAGEKPEGTSGNDLLEAILREREDLREKINSGEMAAYVPAYGNSGHSIIIADKDADFIAGTNLDNAEIFKAPRDEDNIFYRFYEEADWLEKLTEAKQPVPQVTCRGQQSLFFGMKYIPGVPLAGVLDQMTKNELKTLSTDIVNFIIGMANCAPKDNLFPHHADLQECNVLVDPVTKKLRAVLDYGLIRVTGERGIEYLPKLSLWRTGLAKGRPLPGSPDKSLIEMIKDEYTLRREEVSDKASFKPVQKIPHLQNRGMA